MDSLAHPLNRIKTWLYNNYDKNEIDAGIPLGMSEPEVELALSKLPFQVPNEVSLLYQWSAGYDEDNKNLSLPWVNFFDFKFLCSINAARKLFSILEEEKEYCGVNIEYFGKPIFPIFEFNYTNYLAVISDSYKKESSLIINISETRGLTIAYSSLYNMLLTIAKAYEVGALYKDSNGRIEEDITKFSTIYQEYNSEILDYIFDDLYETYVLPLQDLDMLSTKLDNFLDQIAWLNRYWNKLPAIVKNNEKFSMIIKLSEYKDDSISSRAKGILNYLD
jgi:hypothetical protein